MLQNHIDTFKFCNMFRKISKFEEKNVSRLSADLFWSFRSPYSYLGIKRYRQLSQDYDLQINLRAVYPLAIRNPEFFDAVNKNWISYLMRDCLRVAQFNDLPFTFPSPDPVNMDMQTRKISEDQPIIHWITRLGISAAQMGGGVAFADEISAMIWGGTKEWNSDENMNAACQRAGLNYEKLIASVAGQEANLDAHGAGRALFVRCNICRTVYGAVCCFTILADISVEIAQQINLSKLL